MTKRLYIQWKESLRNYIFSISSSFLKKYSENFSYQTPRQFNEVIILSDPPFVKGHVRVHIGTPCKPSSWQHRRYSLCNIVLSLLLFFLGLHKFKQITLKQKLNLRIINLGYLKEIRNIKSRHWELNVGFDKKP